MVESGKKKNRDSNQIQEVAGELENEQLMLAKLRNSGAEVGVPPDSPPSSLSYSNCAHHQSQIIHNLQNGM